MKLLGEPLTRDSKFKRYPTFKNRKLVIRLYREKKIIKRKIKPKQIS